MNIDIVLEGKLKEPYFKDGVNEFKKRLKGYIDLKINEVGSVDDYLKNNLKSNDFVIPLEIEGIMLDSIEFAQKIRQIENDGFYNRILFLIGGSVGLSDYAKQKSTFKFSMSRLTFLHQEALFILTEQIYRSMRILNNEPYHK